MQRDYTNRFVQFSVPPPASTSFPSKLGKASWPFPTIQAPPPNSMTRYISQLRWEQTEQLSGQQLLQYLDSFLGSVQRTGARYGLSLDEIYAILLYTCEIPLYGQMNTAYREHDVGFLSGHVPFLYFLSTGIQKLPEYAGPVFRGLRFKFESETLVAGQVMAFEQFSSASKLLTSTQLENFCQRKGTVLSIITDSCYDLCGISVFGDSEGEVIFLPGYTSYVLGSVNDSRRNTLANAVKFDLTLVTISEMCDIGKQDSAESGIMARFMIERLQQQLQNPDLEQEEQLSIMAVLLEMLFQLEKDDEAVALANEMLVIDPSNVSAAFYLSMLHHEKGNNEYAANLLWSALQNRAEVSDDTFLADVTKHPESALAHQKYACLLLQKYKDYEKARFHFEECLRLDPDREDAHSKFGQLLYFQFGEKEEAKKHFRQVFRINPNNSGVRIVLGQILAEEGDYEEARRHFLIAKRIEPKNRVLFHAQIKVLEELGDFEAARAEYEGYLERVDDDSIAWNNFGRLLQNNLGEYDEARSAYERAMQIDPENPAPYNNLGQLLMDQYQMYDEAKELFLQGLEIDPDNQGLNHNLTNMQRKLDLFKYIHDVCVKQHRGGAHTVVESAAEVAQFRLVCLAVLHMQRIPDYARRLSDEELQNVLEFNEIAHFLLQKLLMNTEMHEIWDKESIVYVMGEIGESVEYEDEEENVDNDKYDNDDEKYDDNDKYDDDEKYKYDDDDDDNDDTDEAVSPKSILLFDNSRKIWVKLESSGSILSSRNPNTWNLIGQNGNGVWLTNDYLEHKNGYFTRTDDDIWTEWQHGALHAVFQQVEQ